MQKHLLPFLRAKWQACLIIVIALSLLAFSGLGFWHKYRATHSPQPLPGNAAITESTANPDETPIQPTSDYHVPDTQPHSIFLPSIKAEGLLQKVGIDQQGAIAVPTNVHVAGWFVGKAVPGHKGLSIIDGHVQGKYQPGIFKNLGKLRQNDKFSIAYGDGSRKQFEVVSVLSYPVEDVSKHLFEQQKDIDSQLNLITCGGRFDKDSNQYTHRVLVVSKLLPN